MNEQEQLREQMWDLVYGLLEQDESRELITRIKSDPQAARLYAEVRLQADLVGYASQVEDSSLVLTGDGAARELAPAANRRAADQNAVVLGRSRSGNILAAIVAAALALLIGVGLLWPEAAHQQLASNFLVIDIESPRDLPGGITREIPVRIARVDGIGQQAEGEATVHSADGRERFTVRFETDRIGHGKVSVPGEAMQPGARLSVAVSPLAAGVDFVERKKLDESMKQIEDRLESRVSSLTAELPVRQEPQVRYFFFESPVAEAGQSNHFALWSFGAISATPVPADISGASVEDLAGTAVSQPMWRADGSLVTGEMPVPESAEQTNYRLAFRDTKGDKFHAPVDGVLMQQERQNRNAYSRRAMDRLDLAMANDAVDARLRRGAALPEQPESPVPLATESAPAAPPARGQPGEVPQGDKQQGDKQEAGEAGVAGEKAPAQQAAKSMSQLAIREEQEKEALSELRRELAKSTMEAAGMVEGVTVEIPAELATRQLKATVRYRGLDIAEKSIDAVDETATKDYGYSVPVGENKTGRWLTLALPPEVRGRVQVNLYDAETSELLYEQALVRESSRRLNVAILDGRESYQPGETVSLTLQFVDENGAAAAGAWGGVRVWNEQVVQSLGDRPLLLADALWADANEPVELERGQERLIAQNGQDGMSRLKSEPEERKLLEEQAALATLDSKTVEAKKSDAAKAQSPDSGSGLDAPEAARFGGQGFGGGGGGFTETFSQSEAHARYFRESDDFGVAAPATVLASNRALVRAEYDAAVAHADDERRATRGTIGRILLFGGIGALLLLGLLALLKLPAKTRVMVPSLAIAAASVVLGLGWIGVHPGANWRQIAMVDQKAELDSAKSVAQPMATPAPETILLDDLMMDADGHDRHDPAGLGGAAGAEALASGYAVAPGGFEAQNAPALAPSDSPAEFDARPLSSAESPAPAAGAGGYGPAGGAAKGPAGRGGADSPRSSEVTRQELARLAAKPEGAQAMKQAEDLSNNSDGLRSDSSGGLRKPALETVRALDKNFQAGGEGRGGSAPPPMPKAMRSIAPSLAPATTSPAPEEASPAASAPTGKPSNPANAGKPASAGSPAAATAAPAAPARAEADEKDAVKELEGKFRKESLGDKPAAPRTSGGEEDREKADRFGAAQRLYASDGATRGAPAAIYFNPRLIADENGRATIEFTMPPVESEYRLLIDALGNGRIGSLQQVIECKEAAK